MRYQAPACKVIELVPEAQVLQASPPWYAIFPYINGEEGAATIEGLTYEDLP
jgi:hypothetical protein